MVMISRLSVPKYGRPSDLLNITRSDLTLARLSLLRIRLILHVSSIRSDTRSFRPTELFPIRSSSCSLCDLNAAEDVLHFIALCPALNPIRDMWLPKIYRNAPPPSHLLVEHALGISGLDNIDQHLILRFLADLYAFRSILISS